MTTPPKSNVEQLAGIVVNSLYLAGVLVILQIAIIVLDLSPRDATDSPTERSNLSLRTDYGTGCQYLATRNGGLFPRLGADGKQMCGARP